MNNTHKPEVKQSRQAGEASTGKGNTLLTRRERVESKEAAIIAAAHEMFAERGFAKSTMAEIARMAGVAEGTVYLYFNNKEALAGGVIASFYDRLTAEVSAGVEALSTTEQKLHFLARHHLTNVIGHRRILELLMVVDRRAESKAGEAIYEMNKRYVAIFDGVVREGVYRGDIAKGFSLWILRDIFYGGLEYAMKTILLTEREGEVSKVTDQLVRMITLAKSDGGDQTKQRAEDRLAQVAGRMEAAASRIEEMLPHALPSKIADDS